MGEKISKIVIENYLHDKPVLKEFNNPEYIKITLVIEGTNVTLYEGREAKSSVP